MSKKIMRLFCIGLCLLMTLPTFVSCSEESSDDKNSVPKEYFTLDSAAYAIISDGAKDDEWINETVDLLNQACQTFIDLPVNTADDWYYGDLERYNVEILIGNTNRPESVEAADDLSYLDYYYEVVSPNVVVICGGSSEATFDAMERFLKDCYGYEQDKSNGELKGVAVGTSYEYRHNYDIKSFELCGSPIDSYTIVHRSGKTATAAAERLKFDVVHACGVELEAELYTKYDGGNAIFIGMGNPDGTHADREYDDLSYAAILQENGTDKQLFLDSTVSVSDIVAAFSNHYIRNTVSEKFELTFEDDTLSVNFKNTDNRLTLYTVMQEKNLADGVNYRKLFYKDRDGEPVIAYVLEADLSKVSLVNATPGNSDQITDVKANTQEAMEALEKAGYTVIAGVNADFFNMSGDHSPRGLCIKDGKLLHSPSNRPWFGITGDGIPVIGTSGEYTDNYVGKLSEAVGGSSIILRNGEYFDVGMTGDGLYSEMAYTRHPRTCVGLTDDGRVILLVVDGRSENSNGASYTDLADIMLELGATDAINLDGGGSSTMVTYSDGIYTTCNVPSDGSIRSVYNSLVIVEK